MRIERAIKLAGLLGASSLLGLFFACGGGGGASGSSTAPTSSATEPKVSIEGSTEIWNDDTDAQGSALKGIREYDLDVTHATVPPANYTGDAGTKIEKLRISVKFPVPKVEPAAARDAHLVNRKLWELRKDIGRCFYKGAGREPTEEMWVIGWLDVDKTGAVKASGVESAHQGLAKGGVDDCILEGAKGLTFDPAGDDAKIRFKIKLQTIDASGLTDFKDTPVKGS